MAKTTNGVPGPENEVPSPRKGTSPTGSTAASRTLPMWAINLIGNTLWGVSRVLWRVSCRGLEHLPTDPRGFIVVANHQTYADPVWLGVQIPRKTRYLAWDEAFRWPLVGTFLHLVGAWPLQIERGNPTAVRRSVQWLREGGALVMFPEGGRCFEDGKISRFKAGAFRIAIEAEVPVVPATIRGGEKVWPQGWRFPRLGRVEVEFHPAVEIECQPGEEPRACARRVSETFFEIVAAGLEESNARQQSGSAKPPKLPSLGKEG